MKKIFLILVLSIFLVGCGKTGDVEIADLTNSYHSIKDMKKAKNVVIRYFQSYYDGCTLQSIWYDESFVPLEQEYLDEKHYDDVIVLQMKFKTDDKQKSLAPNSIYVYRVMVAKENGRWGIVEGQAGQG